MENIRTVIISILVSLASLLMPFSVYAYHTSAHYDLTGKTLLSYEKLFGDVFTSTELTGAAQGAVGEDEGRRPTRHFYDPINNIGLLDHWISSKEWAQDTKEQAKYGSNPDNDDLYFSADTDYSWERAIYEYTYGDKERGMETLGHILHLIQDTTVPAHVRNDDHLNKWGLGDTEPYEEFTAGAEVPNLNFGTADVPSFVSLDDAFDQSATFTNTNFLSEDTIFEGFDNPSENSVLKWEGVEFSDGVYLFGYNDYGKLVATESEYDFWGKKIGEIYTVVDPDNLILTDYWNTLSKQAVLNGVGVIKLFFAEVEKEKGSGVLLAQSKKTWGEVNGLKHLLTGFNLAKNLYGSSLTTNDVDELLNDKQPGMALVANKKTPQEKVVTTATKKKVQTTIKPEPKPVTEETKPKKVILPVAKKPEIVAEKPKPVVKETPPKEESKDDFTSFLTPVPVSPGYGGGGGGGAVQAKPAPQKELVKVTDSGDTTAPNAPTITSPVDFSQTFTSTEISFEGIAEATSTISTNFSDATTSADGLGNWALVLDGFEQGTNTIDFFATDEAGNISEATSTTFSVDSLSSAPELSIDECTNSLSGSSCLVATTTLNISWSAVDDDFDYFVIDNNGTVSTTTATSTQATAGDSGDFVFSVSARDIAGNYSATTTQSIVTNTLPVVINEVAWMGTSASSADEWVELYNNTDSDIDLSGWVFYAEDFSPYINLSGMIPARGYYLIERKNSGEIDEATESPVVDVPADLWTSFGSGLSNSGESLTLARHINNATSTIDTVPTCGGWCGGTTSGYKTMERFDSRVSGENLSNWGTNSGSLIKNGLDIDGNTINGTPKAKNYFSQLLNKGGNIYQDLTLTKSNSPYIVDNQTIKIASGNTLTIEPGVVIKFNEGNSRLTADGSIVASGTADDKIVFTSFLDDEYGEDSNGDGVCDSGNASSTASCPYAGAWYGVVLTSTSENSLFDHTIFRYGGKYAAGPGYTRANLQVDGVSPDITNSVFEYASQYGLVLSHSDSLVANNVFRNNNQNLSSIGMSGGVGSPQIKENVFENNSTGLQFVELHEKGLLAENTFVNNSYRAMRVYGVLGGEISGNSGSENGTNGIIIFGTLTQENATTTLNMNEFPYVLNESNVVVIASSTLAIEPGTVLKFDNSRIRVNGHLRVEGMSDNPILFTSAYDDSDDNDALGDGESVGFVGNSQSIDLNDGSTSKIEHAEFRFMKTALDYSNSPIDLSDVHFADNDLAISAMPSETILRAENITFSGNVATSTIPF